MGKTLNVINNALFFLHKDQKVAPKNSLRKTSQKLNPTALTSFTMCSGFEALWHERLHEAGQIGLSKTRLFNVLSWRFNPNKSELCEQGLERV